MIKFVGKNKKIFKRLKGLEYLRWLNRKSRANSKRKCKSYEKTNFHSNIEQESLVSTAYVPKITETQFIKNSKSPSTPIKILLNSEFRFSYPKKIIIRVSKTQHEKKTDEIDYKYNSKNVLYLKVKSQQFLSNEYEEKLNSDKEKYSISVPQMNLSNQNYELPKFVKNHFFQASKNLYAVNLWHYKKQTVTKWHYDAHDNFLYQIKGIKQILLIPPNYAQSISLPCDSVFNIDNNHVDESKISLEEIQSNPRLQKVTLKEKQCLFIPRGWFHHVKSYLNSQGDNVAINCWGNTIPTYNIPKEQLQINLKQLIYEMSQQICSQNCKDWENLDEEIKQKFRKAYFFQYLQKISSQ